MVQSPLGPGSDPRIRPDEFLEVSWEMFGELCRALAMKVAREHEPEMVVGIARAGVIPGAIIASLLRLDFYSMTISRRDHGGERVRDEPAVLSTAPLQAKGRRVVLVDEICTSGATLRLAISGLRDVGAREISTAASFVRPKGFRPDLWSLETDATLVFPWDRKVYKEGEWVLNPRYAGVIDD